MHARLTRKGLVRDFDECSYQIFYNYAHARTSSTRRSFRRGERTRPDERLGTSLKSRVFHCKILLLLQGDKLIPFRWQWTRHDVSLATEVDSRKVVKSYLMCSIFQSCNLQSESWGKFHLCHVSSDTYQWRRKMILDGGAPISGETTPLKPHPSMEFSRFECPGRV